MSPKVLPFVFFTVAVSIFLVAFYINMERAKERVSYWRAGSSYMFFRSNGLVGREARAKLVWMKQLGYGEADALVISACQGRAITMTFIGFFALVASFLFSVGP